MTRKFKLAGVLMAVVAMFAVTASSASAHFTSSEVPVTPHASSTKDVFHAFGSTVTCTENTFDVEKYNSNVPIDQKSVTTVTVTPDYTKCTGAGLPATINFTGCDYVFHSESPDPTAVNVSLVCPVGVKGVDITIYSSSTHATALCHIVVTPFAPKAGLQIHNKHPHILLTGKLPGIPAHQERTSFVCPPGTETNTAEYTVQEGGITITGDKNQTLSVS